MPPGASARFGRGFFKCMGYGLLMQKIITPRLYMERTNYFHPQEQQREVAETCQG